MSIKHRLQSGQRVLVSSQAGDRGELTAVISDDLGKVQVHFVTDDRTFDWLPDFCVQAITETSETEMLRLLALEADGFLQVVR